MPNNLQLYHKMKQQLGQWLPLERILHLRRNMTWFLTNKPHPPTVVLTGPLRGKLPRLTNC